LTGDLEREPVPELPDITVYMEALEQRIVGHVLEHVQVAGPSLLKTASPPAESAQGRTVTELRRIGKRIAIGFGEANARGHDAAEPARASGGFQNDAGSNSATLWLVFHLMIAGRLHWIEPKPKQRKTPDGRRTLAVLDFDNGTLTLTEAGTRKRASLHVVSGDEALAALDPGGIDVFSCGLEKFSAVLTAENHTLKRSLTDPHFFSGIGNAYSDEILHAAQLSPVTLTQRLKPEEIRRLYDAVRQTLTEWTSRLREDAAGKFPEKVTAFRPEMAVHGRYGQPCPRCGAKVQRIRYASNETNYCANCQTGGKLLADRSLSRLLREDWPRSLEEIEERKAATGRWL
jgi:formamidopyrimidine-DNA glycosylase